MPGAFSLRSLYLFHKSGGKYNFLFTGSGLMWYDNLKDIRLEVMQMNYIVLDMEWNQPWPGSPSARKVLPVAIRGEIIQIGAVRVTEDRAVADEFQIMIKPKFYRSLNRRVSKLTGIKESRLKAEGVPFPDAMEQFRSWCGDDVVFLTWGFDDIGILKERNMKCCILQKKSPWSGAR